MFIRHAFGGLPLMRTRTGSGLRQPGLMAFAREALTRMKGLTPLILMTAVKLEVVTAPTTDLGRSRECGLSLPAGQSYLPRTRDQRLGRKLFPPDPSRPHWGP